MHWTLQDVNQHKFLHFLKWLPPVFCFNNRRLTDTTLPITNQRVTKLITLNSISPLIWKEKAYLLWIMKEGYSSEKVYQFFSKLIIALQAYPMHTLVQLRGLQWSQSSGEQFHRRWSIIVPALFISGMWLCSVSIIVSRSNKNNSKA